MEGETPRRVTVPFELTFAVKERGRAQLDERKTSAGYVGEGGGNGLPVRVSEGILSGSIEPSGSSREGSGSGGGGGGGGGGWRG